MLWDEMIAGRGSEEIGSALLKGMENLSTEISDVHLHLDCCGSQNRNVYLSAKLMETAYMKNIKITHTYLEPGHTHMEADTIHARIEIQEKHTSTILEVPKDRANIIKSIPRGNMLHVNEIKISDFLQVKSLFDNCERLTNRKKTQRNKIFSG